MPTFNPSQIVLTPSKFAERLLGMARRPRFAAAPAIEPIEVYQGFIEGLLFTESDWSIRHGHDLDEQPPLSETVKRVHSSVSDWAAFEVATFIAQHRSLVQQFLENMGPAMNCRRFGNCLWYDGAGHGCGFRDDAPIGGPVRDIADSLAEHARGLWSDEIFYTTKTGTLMRS